MLAAATPASAGDPILVDESLEHIVPETIHPGDIVGISVHTGNALRGYEIGRAARAVTGVFRLASKSKRPDFAIGVVHSPEIDRDKSARAVLEGAS